MKKVFSKIHLYLSLPVGLIISILCLTGAAMVFDAEIHELSNPHLYYVEKVTDKPLPISELIEKLETQIPNEKTVTAITILPNAKSTYQISLSDAGRVIFYTDPYTGQLLGERNKFEKGGFYRTMFYMHRWLMDYSRGEFSWGKLATGISTIAMVLILISGILIWLPKNLKTLKRGLSISITKGWKRFWYDLHISGGVYITAWLLLLGLTGLMWSFTWYRSGVFSIFGVEASIKKTEISTSIEKIPIDFKLWDELSAELINNNPDFKQISLRDGEVRVYNSNYGIRPYTTYSYNKINGDIEKIIPYSDRPESSRFMSWAYAIHTGSWGGIVGKILTFLVALLGGILPITGYYLWIKKQ